MQRFLLSLFLFTSPYVFAEDEAEDKAKWDVSSGQYHTQEINIDTTSTTWSNVTVSRDGKTLVFDIEILSVTGTVEDDTDPEPEL